MFIIVVTTLFLLVSNSTQIELENVNKTIVLGLTESYSTTPDQVEFNSSNDKPKISLQEAVILDNFVLKSDSNQIIAGLSDETIKKTVLPDDFGLNMSQFLSKHGYPFESHSVTTKDGYILALQRIPHGRKGRSNKRQIVVLLMHGLLGSSMDWLYLGPNKSLGLMLADAGYDVWLGNNRGTTLSRKHINLDPNTNKEFWDFSFEKLGYYDVTAFIDYILKITGQKKLRYIGFSQGTTQFYAMAAARPEYQNKIEHATSFAPVVYTTHMKCPLSKFLLKHMNTVKKLIRDYNISEILPHSKIIQDMGKTLCSQGSPLQDLCVIFIFSIVGFDYSQLNRTFLPMLLNNSPSGSSVQSIMHYLQLHESRSFRRYDYGNERNMEAYNSTSPPILDLSRINIPIALFYAANDYLSDIKDVERLASELPVVDKKKLVGLKTFNHLDFMIAKDVHKLVNEEFMSYYDELAQHNDCSILYINYILFSSMLTVNFYF